MDYKIDGLDAKAVIESRERYGSNQLTPQESEGFWDKLKGNFKDPIILILVVALVINVTLAVLGFAEWYEGVGIALAVVLATVVATLSEHKNESAFQKLQEEASQIKNKVFRDGGIHEINIDDIVVGDCVLLQPGDKIPADGSIVFGEVKVSQASLTGEADDVTKTAAPVGVKIEQDLTGPHAVFRGTVISDGEAVMEVGMVGDKSMYGQLAKELASDDRQSPLQVKLSKLAGGISTFGYIGATVIALSFMFKKILIDHDFVLSSAMAYITNWQVFIHDAVTALILAIIIVVVAVPEGLPMMIAIVLSLNMRKLLGDNILVRKLIGIETSGSLNILFSDKTGTITKGQLEAVQFINGNSQAYPTFKEIPGKLASLLALGVTQNSSSVRSIDENGAEQIIGGNLTERALLKFIDAEHGETLNTKVKNIIPFNSSRKFSATQVTGDTDLTLVKGAPEIILQRCRYYYDENGNQVELDDRSAISEKIDELAGQAMRIIAIAASEEDITGDDLPAELNLVGFIGMRDEIRKESVAAIREAQMAGIQVVMITGDRRETATAIAREAGLLKGKRDVVLSSAELNQMSNEQLEKVLPDLRVVERALPTDKSRLVQIAQSMNLVVGMTGDGVNDAPALKRADVGFAMGSGTEIAKDAGDIVILDDNFSSIAKSVLYGRTIFNSIRKFIVFQLTVNVSAILIASLGPFFGFDLPLTVIQLLWVNLVMDTLAALAFGGEAALARYMQEKPKRRDESIINRDMWSSILTNGIVIALFSIVFLTYAPVKDYFHSEAAFLTGFFAFFVFLNNFNKFNARTDEINLFSHILENKGFLKVVGLIFVVQVSFTYFGGEILRTVALTGKEWIFVVLLSTLIIPVDLARKGIRDLRYGISYRMREVAKARAEHAATKE